MKRIVANNILKWFFPYVLISSFQYQFIKDGLDYSSLFVFVALRFVIAGSILLLISKKLVINWDVLVVSAFLSTSTFFWVEGLRYVSTGDSAVLTFSMPLFAIPMATLILREKPSLWEVTGATVGFLGVVLYSLTLAHDSLLIGCVFTIINAVFFAGYSALLRKMKDKESVSLVGSVFLIGSIPFLFGSALYPQVHFTQNFFIDLAYVSILGCAALLWLWNSMLKVRTVGKVTTMSFAVPASTVAIQSMETLTLPSLTAVAGASIMLLGIFIANSQMPIQRIPKRGE